MKKLIPVVTFYVLACAWSWPFFWWRDMHRDTWKALDVPNFLKTWSYMWGPGIAALICFLIFGTAKRRVLFFGESVWRSCAVWFLPLFGLAIYTGKTEVFLMSLLGFIAILGEELGWRGWLQDHLEIKSDVKKAIVIGLMWELWHFTNRTTHGNLVQICIRVAMWWAICSVLSYIALKLTKRTRSLVIAVALHGYFNLAFEMEEAHWMILLALPFWAYLIWTWPKPRIYREDLSVSG